MAACGPDGAVGRVGSDAYEGKISAVDVGGGAFDVLGFGSAGVVVALAHAAPSCIVAVGAAADVPACVDGHYAVVM